uniref:Uncharacterized protein n=1 Tax=Panagrolaimus superbus TaxID=310955 RepID=A0A914XT13_9BILA
MEIDQDFDNDFDFHDAPTDFDDVPSSTQQPLSAKESQDIFAHYDDDNDNDVAYEDADDFGENFFEDVRQETTGGTLDDSLAKIVRRSEVPLAPIISTRPKRNVKKIEFVDDDAHWEKPADKRTKKKKSILREELESQHNDNLLFAPREMFANVTTSRRRTPSLSSSVSTIQEESQRMPRCQDLSLPVKLSDKFTYRLELGQTIPGYAVSYF